MLRNVLDDYLNSLNEKDLYLPFIALLPSLGFYDIHLTHGHVEFGKDVIAKRTEPEGPFQYSFQIKVGDITYGQWRSELMGQMLEAVMSGITHPNFDKKLPHQSVLVTTGDLIGNASPGLNDLNRRIKQMGEKPILFWGKANLLDFFEEYGIETIYPHALSSASGYGNFYVIYGKITQQDFSERDLEKQSREWIRGNFSLQQGILGAAIEGEILARKCIENGYTYEAFHAYLGIHRAYLSYIHEAVDAGDIALLQLLLDQTSRRLFEIAKAYIEDFIQARVEAKGVVANVFSGSALFFTYAVHLLRVLELAGFLYFEPSGEMKSTSINLVIDLVKTEVSTAHVPSDRYGISVVLPVLALIDSGNLELSKDYIVRLTTWLCERYEDGIGLAYWGEDEEAEISILFGKAFEFIEPNRSGSFTAAVLADLAALTEDEELYSSVVNDIKASKVFPCYWQAKDTLGLYDIEGEDIVGYPAVEFNDNLGKYSSFDYAVHVPHEVDEFKILKTIKLFQFFPPLMLFLRDRYFPKLMKELKAL